MSCCAKKVAISQSAVNNQSPPSGICSVSSCSSSFSRLENSESGLAARVAGSSNSIILPYERTIILSLYMIVLSRWAIVIIVHPSNSSAISRWIFYSVTTSMLAVASSRTITFERRIMALQMQSNCFSPEERFEPFSWTV